MQGQQQVIAHVSIGSKQPKKEFDHSAVPVGLVMPDGSFAVADARVTQPSTSCCISDFGAAAMMVWSKRVSVLSKRAWLKVGISDDERKLK